MNERIRQLAKAHLVRDEYTESGWQECHKYSFDEDELEKFAELIVRDIHQYVDGMDTAQVISTGILRRYGVEL